uniref:Uncharacterized protein LOC104219876 n=1 Tax=Nicotiana sylvestris TaxID=4096 RepID=A0A1U7W2S6_NICSY|nr:PREDICTED: uncharacterized protein LOC104219876 [Nicotiana sylvestris]
MVQLLLGFLVGSQASRDGSESWPPPPLTRSVVGLGDAVDLWSAPADEVEVPKPSKERKRKRESSENPPKPKKSVARRPKIRENAPSGSLGVINVDDSPPGPEFSEGQIRDAHNMRSSKLEARHEGHDIFRECLAWLDDGPDLDASFIFDEARSLFKQVVVLHNRAFSKSQVDLARCEAELKKTLEERGVVKALYAKKKMEIYDLRVELTHAFQVELSMLRSFIRRTTWKRSFEELKMKEAETLGWRQGMENLASEKETLREQLSSLEHQLRGAKEESLARGLEIEELKARSAAEMAKVKSDVATIMASYRADAEADNARAREISSTSEAKLSSTLDHARR